MTSRLSRLVSAVAATLLALQGCGSAVSSEPSTSLASKPLAAPATGPVTLVKDLNPRTVSRQPDEAYFFTPMGAYVYFSATSAEAGNELWRTDGTADGTSLVRDIIPGPVGSTPAYLTVWRDRLYFVVRLPRGGLVLYRSDGTAAGTVPHAVIHPEAAEWPVPQVLISTQDALCFVLDFAPPANDTLSCLSEASPVPVRIPGPWDTTENSDFRGGFRVLNGRLYFEWEGRFHERERWSTDGTPEGTSRFGPDQMPELSSGAQSLTSFQGALYFRGGDTAQDCSSLWRTDGTAQGTVRVRQLPGADACPKGLSAQAGTLWMPTHTPDTGVELWKSDGTAEGTRLVKDLWPGPESSGPRHFVALGGTTLFWASSPAGFGVWRTDGTSEGTVFVRATPIPWTGHVLDGVYYFQHVQDRYQEMELWRTDGTAEGTFQVKQLPHGFEFRVDILVGLTSVNGTLLFRGQDLEARTAPWRSDGTQEGTGPLLVAPGTGGSLPRTLTAIGSRLYFHGAPGGPNLGVWTSDGTSEGTSLLHPLASSMVPRPGFAGSEGRTFFSAGTAEAGLELWLTDGTSGGTRLVRDIVPGAGGSRLTRLTPVGNGVYFRAWTPETGDELWHSDGTAEGTRLVRDLWPGTRNSSPDDFRVVGNTLYFTAGTEQEGLELWRTDGTSEGTRLVRDFTPGSDSSFLAPLAAMGDTLYVYVGGALWRTDGTAEGTVLVRELEGGHNDEAVVVGSTLYFILYKGLSGLEPDEAQLWKSDGTPQGTVRLLSAWSASQLTVMGNQVYFLAEATLDSSALWRTDGSVEGTRPVKSMPRLWVADGQVPPRMLALEPEGRLVLAFSDESGMEPWVSDGTPEGTVPIQDVHPGASSSNPSGFVRLGGHVYFAATDGRLGQELWSMPVSALVGGGMPGGDAGTPDAGAEVDAGTPDAGAADAGTTDAGTPDSGTAPDAGTTDAGTSGEPPPTGSGCGCGATSVGAPWLALVLGTWLSRRRHAEGPG